MKLLLSLSFLLLLLTGCRAQVETPNIKIISISELTEAIQKDIQLVDVRTPLEYQRGYIRNAINANIYSTDFSKVISTLDKSKPIYVYCHKGGRSNSACKKLNNLGFTKIFDFKGGWKMWQKSLESIADKRK